MKRLLTIILILSNFMTTSLPAQNIAILTPDVVTFSGNDTLIDSIDLALNWSLGEVIIGELNGGDLILTQGFHQSRIISYPNITSALWQHRIRIFPNPSNEYFGVQFNLIEEGEFRIELLSIQGQLLETWQHTTQQGLFFGDISAYESGVYAIRVIDLNIDRFASFTLINH